MRHGLTIGILALTALVSASTAYAAAFMPRDPEFPPRDYTCRLEGVDKPLGTQACLHTARGSRVAQCGVMLNMSTWRTGDDLCQ